MRKIVEESSVVIAGYWNPSIIVPEWINQYLRAGSDKNIGVKLPIGNPTLPVIYEFDSISLKVNAERIEFVFADNSSGSSDVVIKIVESIVKELNHTPVQAIGINFVYKEEATNDLLLDIFATKDFNRIIELPISLKESQVVRKISFNDSDDFELNFNAILIENEIVKLNFNFNKNIQSLNEAESFIKRGISFYEKKVEDILKIYEFKN